MKGDIENKVVSKSDRTNISLTIDFENVMEVEQILYKILNEISGAKQTGSGSTSTARYTYAIDQYTVEAMTNGDTVFKHKSNINKK